MRFPRPLARIFSLLLLTACPAIVSADGPAMPARRVQIQCIALRARISDVDALGLNFDLTWPKRYSTAFASSLSDARLADSAQAAEMINLLTSATFKGHHSVFRAVVIVTPDGQPGIVSLAKMSDPGLAETPCLVVIPHVQADGAVSLFVSPQFRFVSAPGTRNDPPPTITEAFPVRRTIPNGGMMAFTEEPKPKSQPLTSVEPLIKWYSGPVRKVDSSALWVFFTVTVLPQTPTPIPRTEPTPHA